MDFPPEEYRTWLRTLPKLDLEQGEPPDAGIVPSLAESPRTQPIARAFVLRRCPLCANVQFRYAGRKFWRCTSCTTLHIAAFAVFERGDYIDVRAESAEGGEDSSDGE